MGKGWTKTEVTIVDHDDTTCLTSTGNVYTRTGTLLGAKDDDFDGYMGLHTPGFEADPKDVKARKKSS